MKIGKLRLFKENILDCRSAIFSGATFEQSEGDVALTGGLYASSSIGKLRDNQEDAVLLVKHPEDEEIKMMAVADGVGGEESGEVASHMAVDEIRHWFENIAIEEFDDLKEIEMLVRRKINEINWKIKKIKLPGIDQPPATTLVCAIIGKEQTIIANIGDSRAYIYKDRQIQQVTNDDTVAVVLESVNIKDKQQKDDLRFDKEAGVLVGGLGGTFDEDYITYSRPHITVINNSEYDALMLFSDGVTDCLSDDQILAVTRHTKRSELAKKLVEKALNTNTKKRKGLVGPQYKNEILGGKDNTTAAVYYPDDR